MSVAQTILRQLGGNKFVTMTGAKQLIVYPDALSFQLPAGTTKNKANYVKITLNKNDLYDVSFCKIFRLEMRELSRFDDISSDGLGGLFTSETGLDTYL